MASIVTVYNYDVNVNLGLLDEEIRGSSFAELYLGALVDESTDPDSVAVVTSTALSVPENDELDAIVATHNPLAVSDTQVLVSAMKFGTEFVERWNARMSADAIALDLAHEAAIAVGEAFVMCITGSLHAAEIELASVAPVQGPLDQARIDAMRNEIREYLGIAPI
jgi:hypothetical protein